MNRENKQHNKQDLAQSLEPEQRGRLQPKPQEIHAQVSAQPKQAGGIKKNVMGIAVFVVLVVAAMVTLFLYTRYQQHKLAGKEFSATTFVMDTLVTQQAYGASAVAAMQQVNIAFSDYEDRLSLFEEDSDIAKINASAGGAGVEVAPDTAALLEQSLALSAQSKGAFAISIAPLTLAWGITTDTPRVVPKAELAALVPLVNDGKVSIEGNVVTLQEVGMGLDLGGIAKGAACSLAERIYQENGVESALLSIGGNIYARGLKPDGTLYRIGFRDPTRDEFSYIASFHMQDEVIAVSGGYERYFDEGGKRYIHIIDPRTGLPAESDIVTVAAIDKDGGVADYYSTTLFVWGKVRTLAHMRSGGKAILLDGDNNLYVSASLQDSFKLHDDAGVGYQLQFVEAE